MSFDLSNPAWIAVFGTLAGGLLVGVIALFAKLIELRYERASQDRMEVRKRLEELFEEVTTFALTIQNARRKVKDWNKSGAGPEVVVEQLEPLLLTPYAKMDFLHQLYARETIAKFDAIGDRIVIFLHTSESLLKKEIVDIEILNQDRLALLSAVVAARDAVREKLIQENLVPNQRWKNWRIVKWVRLKLRPKKVPAGQSGE